jgi:hypothetical protein
VADSSPPPFFCDRLRLQAARIHAGDAHRAEPIEDPAACYRAYGAEEDVQQQAFAGLVDDLAGNKSRQETQNDPSPEGHQECSLFECVDQAAAD